MAPKEAPKAKAAGKAKAKKEEKAEDATPKVDAPDLDKHNEAIAAVQAVIDKLQKESQALSAKMNERNVGKEGFFAQKAVIRAELDEVSGKMNGFRERKDAISKQLGEKTAEKQEMKQALGKMKKSVGLGSEAEIDDRIATIEFKLWTESISLKEEKNYLAEIKELKKNKPKLAQVSEIKNKLDNFDTGGSLAEQRKEINENMARLFDQKKEIKERLDELTASRENQMGDYKEVAEKQTELKDKIRGKIEERQKLRDAFGEAKRAFQVHLAEQRRLKQAKYEEDRQQRDAEWKIQKMQKQVEALDDQPYVSEITLIEQTMAFCRTLLPKDEVDSKVEKKAIVHTNKEGEEIMLSKENREEECFYVPIKGKAAKAAKKKDAKATDGAKKPIKHNAETFKLFDSLKLDAPITTADIPALMEKLEKQMEGYQAKVNDWEENKEELKRKIQAGIDIKVDELETKDEAKEEEKEEEKEEAKEEEKEEEKEE